MRVAFAVTFLMMGLAFGRKAPCSAHNKRSPPERKPHHQPHHQPPHAEIHAPPPATKSPSPPPPHRTAWPLRSPPPPSPQPSPPRPPMPPRPPTPPPQTDQEVFLGSLCDDANSALEFVGDVLGGLVGQIPEVGALLSGLFLAFWPGGPSCGSTGSIVGTIMTYVGQDIAAQAITEQANALDNILTGVKSLMGQYDALAMPVCNSSAPDFQKRDKLLDLATYMTTSDPSFTHALYPELGLVQIALFGTLNVGVHREKAVFYEQLNCGPDPDHDEALAALANTVARYTAEVQQIYASTLTDRMANITTSFVRDDSGLNAVYTCSLFDNWNSPSGNVTVDSVVQQTSDDSYDLWNYLTSYMTSTTSIYNISTLQALDAAMIDVLAQSATWPAAMPAVGANATTGAVSVLVQPPLIGGLCWSVNVGGESYNPDPVNNCVVSPVSPDDPSGRELRTIELWGCGYPDVKFYEGSVPYLLTGLSINHDGTTYGQQQGVYQSMTLSDGEYVTRVDVGVPHMDSFEINWFLQACYDDFKTAWTSVGYLGIFTNQGNSLVFDMKSCPWYGKVAYSCNALPMDYNITTIQLPENGTTSGVRLTSVSVNPNIVINHPGNDDAWNTIAGLAFEYTDQRPTLQPRAPQTLRSGMGITAATQYDQPGFCVVGNGSSVQLVIQPCDPSSLSQLFVYDRAAQTITQPSSGLCVDVQGASTSSGADAILFACNGAANQRWAYTAKGQLMPQHVSGMCMDVTDGFEQPGQPVEMYPCNGGPNENFSFV